MDETKLKPCPFCGGPKIFVGSVAEIELMDKYDENYDLYNSQFQVVCDSIAGGCGASSGCCKNKAAAIEALRATYQQHFDYFERDDAMVVRGRKTRGLGLPAAVLEKFYRTNAQEWYPGLRMGRG